jgi:hypothetical protein
MHRIPSLQPSRRTLRPAVLLVAIGALVPACRATVRPATAASLDSLEQACAGRRALLVDNRTNESVELSARLETLWGSDVPLGTVLPGTAELELPRNLRIEQPDAARLFRARGVSTGHGILVRMPSSRGLPMGPYVEVSLVCADQSDAPPDSAGGLAAGSDA